jgi:hypothetical protein
MDLKKNKIMNKYFNPTTGREILLNKPFNAIYKDELLSFTVSTKSLSQELADSLVEMGVLVTEEPSVIPTNIPYYVEKLAKKLKISVQDCGNMLLTLEKYAPATVFSLLAKQVALELDSKYEGHIAKSKNLFSIELTEGRIVPMIISDNASLKNITLFRSVEDARFAIKVLKPFYDQMYQ